MTNPILAILAVSSFTMIVSACTQENKALSLPPGTYESNTSSTDAGGTTTERKNVTDVDVDQYGRKTAVVKSKTTKDPKGLFNKTTTNKSETVVQEK